MKTYKIELTTEELETLIHAMEYTVKNEWLRIYTNTKKEDELTEKLYNIAYPPNN